MSIGYKPRTSEKLLLTVFAIAISEVGTTQENIDERREKFQIEETIVTAQRRTQNLQDVPIAISAIGEDELAARNIVDLSSLRGVVPGLSISEFAGVNVSNLVSIRGVSGQPLPIGGSQATAIYLDGVYLSRPDSGFFGLDDVERLEVLRGPQGALYGRNATAGAINIVTRTPSNEAVTGGVNISYGNFGELKFSGSLSGPLAKGWSAGISGSYSDREGYFKNTFDGKRVGDSESHTVRAKLHYSGFEDKFDALLSIDESNSDSGNFFKQVIEPLLPPVIRTGIFSGIGDPDEVTTNIPELAYTEVDSSGVSLTMNWEVSEKLVLTSISSWRENTTTNSYDGDGTAFPSAPDFIVNLIPAAVFANIRTASDNETETFSQELRGVYSGASFQATFGFNYFQEDATFGISFARSPADPALFAPYDTSDLEAYAVFGQVEFELTERVTLVGGLRYNHEQRDYTIDYTDASAFTLSTATGPFESFIEGDLSDDVLIPSVGVNFVLNPDVLLYAKASKGYLAPGFNFFPGVAFAGGNEFDAEDLLAYELGLKAQFFDNRMTSNVAVFYYDYTDLQVRNLLNPGETVIDNAGTATVEGFEASITAHLNEQLSFSTQFTFAKSEYADYCQPISPGTPQGSDTLCSDGTADRSGNLLNQAPEWSGGVNASYHAPVGEDMEFFVNLSYSRESNVYYTTANEDAAESGGWERVDARIALRFLDGPEFYLSGKNLTNDRYPGQAFRLADINVLAAVSAPRTYSVGVRYRF